MVFLVGRRERVWCAFLFNLRSTSRAGGGRRKVGGIGSGWSAV